MKRIVLVSNRVATLIEGKPSAGGLAVAVVEALRGQHCLWLGWNGKVVRVQDEDCMESGQVGTIETRVWPLSQRNYDGFYRGFANSVLWPAFHYRLDHMHFSQEDYQSYLRVNQSFAKRLAEHVNPDDVIWAHDYHFMHLASFCRELGMKNRIGFFLHIPFPTKEIFRAIPVHHELSKALSDYDLVGFQTKSDLQALRDYLGTRPHGLGLAQDVLERDDTMACSAAMGTYPISIDCTSTIKDMELAQRKRTRGRLQREFGNARLIIGVDRLDCTKGLVERLRGYEEFLRLNPAWRTKVSFMQISPPSRTDVHGYGQIRRDVELLTSQINGKWAEPSWMPINYINRSFDRPTLLAFFQRCHVCLVTSLRDGMNLVAKEYVTVQSPDDPGVLILSEFAGAAEELCTGAVIVNPYDATAMADAIKRALSMDIDERRERHASMMGVLRRNNLQTWRKRFMHDLLRLTGPDAAP